MANDYNRYAQQTAIKRARRFAALRNSGMTWAEIGKVEGITRQRAQQIVRKFLERRESP